MIISLIHHPLIKILVLSFHLIWTGLITSNTFLVKLIKHLVSYAVLSVIVTLFMLKKMLFLSLVRPKLIYCSCVWPPHLIKDIVSLEKVQCRATKFILNDFSSDYKSRLLRLNLFPLMLLYEYYDIIFFFKFLKSPSSSFNINNYVSFASSSTRSSANSKLLHTKSTTNSSRHFYFNRLTHLWNSLPVLSLEQSLKSFKQNLKIILWNHLITHFDPDSPCSFHFVCPYRSCTPLSLHHNFTQAV